MQKLQDVLITEHGLGASLSGWTLTDALDISDDGNVIVGAGYNPAGEHVGFIVRIPEPVTLPLAVAAIFICRQRVRAEDCPVVGEKYSIMGDNALQSAEESFDKRRTFESPS